jgi:small-conductance mechanosensitive channel
MEDELMKQARRRVNFKAHLVIFMLGNILLWILYALFYYLFNFIFPWAIFPTSIWFVVLILHYFIAFKWNDKWVDREYQKLLEEQRKKNSISESQ